MGIGDTEAEAVGLGAALVGATELTGTEVVGATVVTAVVVLAGVGLGVGEEVVLQAASSRLAVTRTTTRTNTFLTMENPPFIH